MIVLEKSAEYIMISQHDHAALSAQFARKWIPEQFLGFARFADVIDGIAEHDRSWIDLDSHPFFHDAANAPYSFIDFPLTVKLRFYRIGLDEIEKMNQYGSLLASMHYASFFAGSRDEIVLEFLQNEAKRQERLMGECAICTQQEKDELAFHYRLLQLCDDLSLYVCLNEPGVSKKDEHPWFREGFSHSEHFHPNGNSPLIANWLNKEEITFSFFPFADSFPIDLFYRAVPKNMAETKGIAQAYKQTPVKKQTFFITERTEI